MILFTGYATASHPTQIFFHKYFSRKNRRQLAQPDQDDNSEEMGSAESQDGGKISDQDGDDSEHEVDEEGSSEAEEDAVWKVRPLRAPCFLCSCKPPGYASYHTA